MHDRPLVDMGIDVSSRGKQVNLCALSTHAAILDQPTHRDRRTARSTRFAMDIDHLAALNMLLDKLDGTRHVVQTWVREIGRRHVELIDPQPFVVSDRAAVLFAGIDHRADAGVVQPLGVAGERITA